jgi:hypothetical protein
MDRKDEVLIGIPPEMLLGVHAVYQLYGAVDREIEEMLQVVSPRIAAFCAPMWTALHAVVRSVALDQTEGREQWEFAFYVPKLEITPDFRCSLPTRLTVGCPSDPLEEPRHESFDVSPDATLDWILGWLGPRRAVAAADPTLRAKDQIECELWLVTFPIRDERIDLTCPITVKLPDDRVEVLEYPADTVLTVASIISRVYTKLVMKKYPWLMTTFASAGIFLSTTVGLMTKVLYRKAQAQG